ncbi:hypothetical protein BUALT_Bualt14G0041900 [Buddleja alternifolia]|uniref:Uncharacterized protein n=1 Tax=Buddleja alternifolia TaxID=168488 RepID=A0AAV6WQ50_9LAMI|nr:hypothetical protein BUALT_Bualt14G0041900 [Buddleja alternifolia]
MSKNYDSWEKLVRAVMRRDQLRQIALLDSASTRSSISSSRSSTTNNHPTEITPISGSLIFSLDGMNGNKCYMLGARELLIAWGDNTVYWNWISDPDSRFAEVALLVHVSWLDIIGKINTGILSPSVTYAGYLVFKLAEKYEGLKSANAISKFVNDEIADSEAEKRETIVHLQPGYSGNGQVAVRRADGWMEIEIGKFYVDEGDDKEVEVRLLSTKHRKTGLIVEGIEFRPEFIETPFVSPQYVGNRRRNGRGIFSNMRISQYFGNKSRFSSS